MQTQKLILIIGAPGSGKGTVANSIKSDQLLHISTGDMLRASSAHEGILNSGGFVPDEDMNKLVYERLKKEKATILLDGYPRTINQYNFLIENKILIEKVIYLNLDLEVALERLLKRGRGDDNRETIKKRFEEYEKSTFPIIEKLKKDGVNIISVDASNKSDDVVIFVKKHL